VVPRRHRQWQRTDRRPRHGYDVVFTEADHDDLATVDAAYRAKYGQYPSIVDHLEEDGPRAATLHVHPA
jgi:hypothetical protein